MAVDHILRAAVSNFFHWLFMGAAIGPTGGIFPIAVRRPVTGDLIEGAVHGRPPADSICGIDPYAHITPVDQFVPGYRNVNGNLDPIFTSGRYHSLCRDYFLLLGKIIQDVSLGVCVHTYQNYLAQNTDTTYTKSLEKSLLETEKAIANLLCAIEAGISNESTKDRMNELEQQRSELKVTLAAAKLKENLGLRKEHIAPVCQYGLHRCHLPETADKDIPQFRVRLRR